MQYGFVKTAALTPSIRVADCAYNARQIIEVLRAAAAAGAEIACLPELCITGYTCGDLFFQPVLQQGARDALADVLRDTAGLPLLFVLGLPLTHGGKLYNCAAVCQNGRVLGVVPKTHLPNYNEFYEKRQFTPAPAENGVIDLSGAQVPFGTNLLFQCGTQPALTLAVEICEDLWVPIPPSSELAMQGANLIFNLSASNELIGKHAYLRSLICQQSARCIAGYVYASAGFGESSTDLVFAGNGIIAENGTLLRESERVSMEEQLVISEIDIQNLQNDRRINTSFMQGYLNHNMDNGTVVSFSLPNRTLDLTRAIDPHPFTPSGDALKERCEEIFHIQVAGLAKRVLHAHAQTAVVGISGGLDSTLALLVTVMTFDALKIPRDKIIGITMPGFGTTDRTYNNALELMRGLGVTIREIPIRDACTQHFSDIGLDPEDRSAAYENSQARERTQILMDVANMEGGLVVGTGDLSELALGWATYNGDQMSMYGVNASVPKTLVRHLVKWVADTESDMAARATLLDVIDTPVSPELLPADKEGKIAQKTEDLVGPYELHDFFLYNFIRAGYGPAKILFLAEQAFHGSYDRATILKWLTVFFRRFFSQQFKRSAMPDGPKVGSAALSPRGDWRMPSDASAAVWLKELETLKYLK